MAGILDEQGVAAREVISVGVGVPGPVDYVSGRPMAPPLMPGWDLYPVREAFVDGYDAPVFVDNEREHHGTR